MLAAVVDRYGPPEVVAVREVPDPAPPGPGQVLVRVHATSVNSGDARIRGARFPWGFGLPARLAFGLRGPRRPVLGGVYSGVVVALGPGVPHLREGEQVAGMTGPRMGAHAELAVVPANRLTALPAGVSHEDAAGILFGATTARYFLADTPVGPTARVLVIGASGAVGTAAVQLAALAGAQVTGVCSAANADLVTDLGADQVLDYSTHPPTELPRGGFDVVVDAVGTLSTAQGRSLLTRHGVLCLVAADLSQTIAASLAGGSVRAGAASEDPADMAAVLDLVADGRVRVVRGEPGGLEDVVSAHRLVDSGRKVGSGVLRVVAR